MPPGRSRVLNFILAADAKQVSRAFTQAERSGDRYAKHTEHVHDRAQRSYAGSAKSALKWAAGVGAAYVSITKARSAIASTEELGKATAGLHRNLGLSVKEASRWAGVAKARDIDNKAMTMSFTTLSKQVEAANDGSEKQQQLFAKLGITQADLKRGTHDFSGLVTQLADGFGKLHGGTERQAAAQQLLGRGYQSILPLFAEGSKSLREQLHWADQYGVTLDKKTLEPIKKLTTAQRELKMANLGLQVAFTKATAPALLKVEGAALKVLRVMNDPKLTSEEKWQKISDIVGPIADKISEGVTSAIPKIAEGVGHHAPQVAGAFVKGFMHADAWGKLALAGWLFAKFGGFGTFGKAGSTAGKTFSRRFGLGIAAGFLLLAPDIGKALGKLLVNAEIEAAKGGGLSGDIARKMLGADPRKDVVIDKGDRNKQGEARILSLPSRYQGGLAVGDYEGQAISTHGGKSRRSGGGPIGDRPQDNTPALREYRKQATAARQVTDALGASQKRAVDGLKVFTGATREQTAAQQRSARVLAEWEKTSTSTVKAIGDKLSFHTKRGRDAVVQNFKSTTTAIANAMRRGEVSADDGMFAIRQQMRIHSKGGATVVDANFKQAVRSIRQGMDRGEIRTKTGMRAIRGLMSDLSHSGAGAVARNMGTFQSSVFDAMKSGKITTKDGMEYIAAAFNKSAKAFGFGKNVVLGIGSISKGVGSLFKAGGGWIGRRGEAGADEVPAWLGRGEAVLNRYQQEPVDTALQLVYGMNLDDLFAREQRSHSFAKGGRPNWGGHPPLGGGIASAVGAVQRAFPALVVTSTTDHSTYTTSGNVSDHTKGIAADVAADSGTMYRASEWIKSSGLARSLKQGIHNPNLAVQSGQVQAPPGSFAGHTWTEHLSHIHMAVQGMLRAGVSVDTIKRALVKGPDSPLKRIVQKSLDLTRTGANKKLQDLAAQQQSSAGIGGLSGFKGGGSQAANMALGHRMMLAAGFSESQWPALRALWQGESGWDNNARNPSSGAYGIPQALGHGSVFGSNPADQIRWGLNYIKGRYGSPSAAYSAWLARSPHWYGRGGRVARLFGRGGFATGGRSGGSSPSTSRHWNPFTHAYAFVSSGTYQGWQRRWQAAHPHLAFPTSPSAGSKPPATTRNINPISGHTERHTSKQWAAIRLRYRQQQQREARATRREDTHVGGFTRSILGNAGHIEGLIEDTGLGIEDYGSAFAHQQRINDFTTEDLFTAEGRETRTREVGQLQYQKALEGGAVQWKRRLVLKEARKYKRLIARLRKELRRKGLTAASRKSIRTRLREAVAKYKDLRRQGKQLGIELEDIALDLNELGTGLAAEIKEATPTELDYLTSQQAQAALTADTKDDLAAAEAFVKYGTTAYNEAVKSGDPRKIAQAATDLKGFRDALDGLAASNGANTDAVKQLADEMKRQNDQRAAYQAIGERTALDMLTAIVSGRMGANVLSRGQARTYGTVARA